MSDCLSTNPAVPADADYSVDLDDGKYTVYQEHMGGVKALRHGEPWRDDLAGDTLVYFLMVELIEAKQMLAAIEYLRKEDD